MEIGSPSPPSVHRFCPCARRCWRSGCWPLSGCCWWNGSSAPGGWFPHRGNLSGSAGCFPPARRASRRSTGHRHRRSSRCCCRPPADGSGVLDAVGITEFVHQHVGETFAVVVEDMRLVQPQLVRAQQQLGEIHQPRAIAGFLIGLIDAQRWPLPDCCRSRRAVAAGPRLSCR